MRDASEQTRDHYTPDAQAAYDKATQAGAQSILAVQGIETHVEDVSEEG